MASGRRPGVCRFMLLSERCRGKSMRDLLPARIAARFFMFDDRTWRVHARLAHVFNGAGMHPQVSDTPGRGRQVAMLSQGVSDTEGWALLFNGAGDAIRCQTAREMAGRVPGSLKGCLTPKDTQGEGRPPSGAH